MGKAKRQSGVELLRIIAMLQIIFLHVSQYGELYKTSASAGDIDGFIVEFMWSLCRAPVNVFVMISGYFMITSTASVKKMIKRASNPYGAMMFYSIVISAIFFISDPSIITLPGIIKTFMPFSSKMWYFLTNYIIILLISPFLNKMLVSLTKKQYLYFMGIIFAVMSVWSTLAKIDGLDEIFDIAKVVDPYYGKSLAGFLMMYVIGGYLRLFVKQKERKNGAESGVNMLYLIIFFLLCTFDFGLNYLFPQYSHVFGMFNNPIVVAESVLLLLFFRDFKFSSGFINTVAGTTLGVYAIHEHYLVREWLWSVVSFSNKSLYDTLLYIPMAIGACVGVFVICCIIELIRLKLFRIVSDLYNKRKSIKQKV